MKRDTFRCWLVLAVMVLVGFSTRLVAHPGHGLTGVEPLHSLTSPAHLLGLTILGVVLWAAGIVVRARAAGRILQYAGYAVALGAAAIWGLQ